MKAQKIYQQLRNNGMTKLIRSLDAIKKVCDELENKGLKIYVTKVGRECEQRFGSPKLQSIRNNKDLIKYIELREQEQVFSPIKEKTNDVDSSFIELLNDYKRENRILRGLLKKISIKKLQSYQ